MNEPRLMKLPIAEIFADDSFNCRGAISPLDVNELMTSIKAEGLLQPIIVQTWDKDGYKYRILCGHRRFYSFKFLVNQDLKFQEIPAIVHDDITDSAAALMNFNENLNRKDLTILQEAQTLERLLGMGLTLQNIAKQVGKSYGWVQVRKDLLTLPKDVQIEVEAGVFSQEQVKDLASVLRNSGEAPMYDAARRAKDIKLTSGKVVAVKEKKVREKPKVVEGNPRTVDEIVALQDCITDSIGPGILPKVLGWALHYVKTNEILEALEAEYGKLNVPENLANSEF